MSTIRGADTPRTEERNLRLKPQVSQLSLELLEGEIIQYQSHQIKKEEDPATGNNTNQSRERMIFQKDSSWAVCLAPHPFSIRRASLITLLDHLRASSWSCLAAIIIGWLITSPAFCSGNSSSFSSGGGGLGGGTSPSGRGGLGGASSSVS